MVKGKLDTLELIKEGFDDFADPHYLFWFRNSNISKMQKIMN